MKISIARKDRAFAVIIALVAVTVLTLLAGAFAYSMKVETRLAANTNDDEKFYWAGRGGVERACWGLGLSGGWPFSDLQQYWAGGPGDGPETNGPLGAGESMLVSQIGDATIKCQLTELDGRINVNSASSQLLQQMVNEQVKGGADPNVASTVSDSILDWITPGDNARPSGAKSDYYLGLNPPYNCKDALIDNLDELLLIKGVTRDMYYGISSSDSTTPFPENQLGFGHEPGKEQYVYALKDVFTPYSSGQVNYKTAPDAVKLALVNDDENLKEEIDNRLNSDPPIRDINAVLGSIDPALLQSPMASNLGNKGNTYQIDATVTIGQLQHTYTAIVVRNGPNVTIFNFYRSD